MTRHLCVLPWIHTEVEYHGWTKVCAVSGCGSPRHIMTGCIKDTSVLDIIHQKTAEEIRTAFLKGEWHDACAYCRNREKMGMASFRQEHNARYPHLYDALRQGKLKPGIRTLDLRLSNGCNFKCRMCSGWPSTTWRKDHNLIYPDNLAPKRKLGIMQMPGFWSDFQRVAPTLEGLQIAGGEPFIMPECYRVLETLLDCGNDRLHLYFDSNFGKLQFQQWDAIDILKRFKNVTVSLSFEGVGEQGEYIRHGLNYKRWTENVRRLCTEAPHVHRRMHFTISIFNALNFRNHYDAIMDMGVINPANLELTFVEWPAYLSIQCLRPNLKKEFRRRIAKMLNEDTAVTPEIAKRLRAARRFVNATDLYPTLGPEFVRITRLLDEQRKESVLDTFPELAPMFV